MGSHASPSQPGQQQQQPIGIISAATTAPASAAAVKAPSGGSGKPDSDQHDSGVELNSDHHGSNPSSQRNSPSAESKADNRLIQVENSQDPIGQHSVAVSYNQGWISQSLSAS